MLQLRECFCSRGFAGKHVAVVGENCYDWLLVYLARRPAEEWQSVLIRSSLRKTFSRWW